MKNKQEIRRAAIMEFLIKKNEVSTAELMERYNVTSETIRKDLVYLENLGAIEKRYGKAVLTASYLEKPVNIRLQHEHAQKEKIGAEAAKLIQDGTVVFIDGGSTALQVAEHIASRRNITIVTNSLPVAQCLLSQEGDNEVYLCGGFVKRGAMTTKGLFTYESLSSFKTSIAFMGTNGMLYHDGATCKDYDDIEIKNVAMRQAERSILLCASNKFEKGAVLQYAKWEEFSCIITDGYLSDESRRRLNRYTQVQVIE